MKIAVLGAGYCGLAAAWHLSSFSEVTIFDANPLGKASAASTGMLHPFLGVRPKLSWGGFQAFDETRTVLSELQSDSKVPIFKQTGIFRPVLHKRQEASFLKLASLYNQVEWVDSFQEKWNYPHALDFAGIWIPSGVCVFSLPYITLLQNKLISLGVQRVHKNVDDLSELDEYDHVIIATGSEGHLIEKLTGVSFDRIKGQALICSWPENIQPPPMSIIGQGHVCMTSDQKSCFIGSTYERNFSNEDPTDVAHMLKEKVGAFFPLAKKLRVEKVISGVRMYRKDSPLPLLERVSEKVWAFTAIGSRGLLLHHYLAKKLAKAIESNNSKVLSEDVKINDLLV